MDNVLIEDNMLSVNLLDTSEVSILLNICEETVRRWCRDEKIKATKLSNKGRSPWRIRGLDLGDFLLEHPKYYGNLFRTKPEAFRLHVIRIELLEYIGKRWKERY